MGKDLVVSCKATVQMKWRFYYKPDSYISVGFFVCQVCKPSWEPAEQRILCQEMVAYSPQGV